MSWVNILKKNDKEFEVTVEKEVEIKEDIIHIYDPNILDIDEEFDNLFANKIYDIKFDFKQVIDDNTLPFLNIKSTKNLFFDFIKYNCSNYYKLKKRVNKENEEYLNELEEEEQEYYDLSIEND
jgi:hypothetical protein